MTKDKFTCRYRLGLNSLFVPHSSPSFINVMSFSTDVTEKDMINLVKLAGHQKNQRATKSQNRILKQTHDVKLAESFECINKKLEKVDKSTKI